MLSMMILRWLLVGAVSVCADIEMEFTQWPESVTAPIGDEVTFECTVRVPGERLVWRWKPFDSGTDWIVLPSKINEKVSSRYVLHIKDEHQAGYYQCVVWYGAVSLASVPGRLTVARMNLSGNSSQKRVINAPFMSTVVLHCKAPLSDPPAIMSWWKEEKDGTKRPLETPHGVLVIPNATLDDTGFYRCSATNDFTEQVLELPERTYLKVKHEGRGGNRFLESEDIVDALDGANNERNISVPPNGALRLFCGIVGNPQPSVSWHKVDGYIPGRAKKDGGQLVIPAFRLEDQGIYSCSAGSLRRSWRVLALEAARWEGSAGSVNGTEGGGAKVSCGTPYGVPKPEVFWLLNALPIDNDRSIKTVGTELVIDSVKKRHAGIVQCFACNTLGCAYDAALLTVVPVQISDQEYSAEAASNLHFPSQPPKRHPRKNQSKHKPVMVPPSRPTVTRMSDESVMLSWSNANHGLQIQFFKIQYKEATNSSSTTWHTESNNIPPYIHSYEVHGLTSDRYYKFRIAAVYSNQDNKQGRSSNKFYLQRGAYKSPKAPVLTKAAALSPTSLLVNWTWSSDGGVPAEGFYVYYRAVSSAGEYEKVTAGGGASARSIVLPHLNNDTAYEVKLQAYTAQAPSDFTAILTAKTLRPSNILSSTELTPSSEPDPSPGSSSNTVATAGGAIATGLTLLLVALLICRRARRMHRPSEYKEKGSVPEGGGGNGYIPAKVPITITANPMHAESGDSGVEMSYMHNNNTGSQDNGLSHARKNGVNRQYV